MHKCISYGYDKVVIKLINKNDTIIYAKGIKQNLYKDMCKYHFKREAYSHIINFLLIIE